MVEPVYFDSWTDRTRSFVANLYCIAQGFIYYRNSNVEWDCDCGARYHNDDFITVVGQTWR
jgi:protein involved in ribonucleotide reduction